MKKILLLFLPLFLITACTNSNSMQINEKNAPENINTYNSVGEINKINNVKDGATPKVKPTGETGSASQPASEEKGQGQEDNKIEIQNLASEFSGALIKTSLGDIEVSFYAEESPLTVNNFMNLASEGFYDSTRFHRVIDDFMIQGGDPLSKDLSKREYWGTGGPGYKFKDEINSRLLVKGSLAMANSGENTNGSQFFIVTKEATPWLDGMHTNFGEVVSGMDVVEKIEAVETDENDKPIEDVIVEAIELLK